jgi:hypothetical protein
VEACFALDSVPQDDGNFLPSGQPGQFFGEHSDPSIIGQTSPICLRNPMASLRRIAVQRDWGNKGLIPKSILLRNTRHCELGGRANSHCKHPRNRNDRLQELEPQCSRYECPQSAVSRSHACCIPSRFSIEPLRNIGTRLVNYHSYIVALRD